MWTLQQRQAQNNLREDMHDHIRMGVELGERFVSAHRRLLGCVFSQMSFFRAYDWVHLRE